MSKTNTNNYNTFFFNYFCIFQKYKVTIKVHKVVVRHLPLGWEIPISVRNRNFPTQN